MPVGQKVTTNNSVGAVRTWVTFKNKLKLALIVFGSHALMMTTFFSSFFLLSSSFFVHLFLRWQLYGAHFAWKQTSQPSRSNTNIDGRYMTKKTLKTKINAIKLNEFIIDGMKSTSTINRKPALTQSRICSKNQEYHIINRCNNIVLSLPTERPKENQVDLMCVFIIVVYFDRYIEQCSHFGICLVAGAYVYYKFLFCYPSLTIVLNDLFFIWNQNQMTKTLNFDGLNSMKWLESLENKSLHTKSICCTK